MGKPTNAAAAIGLPDNTNDWSGEDFEAYYNNLVGSVGVTQARIIANQDITATSITSTIYWSGSFDCDWLRYAQQNGLVSYGGIGISVYCDLESATDAAGNVIDSAGKLSSLIYPAAVVGLLGVGFWAAVHYKLIDNPFKRKRK